MCAFQTSKETSILMQPLITLIIIRVPPAQDSFHGTAISLFQHPRPEASGEDLIIMTVSDNSHISKRVYDNLLQSYTDVPPVAMTKKDPVPPKFEGSNKADCVLIPQASHGKRIQVVQLHVTFFG